MTKEQSSTSTQEVPKVKLALQEKYEEQDKKENKKQEDLSNKESSKLPKPTGWRLLVLPFKMKEKTKGGIIMSDMNNVMTKKDTQRALGVKKVTGLSLQDTLDLVFR